MVFRFVIKNEVSISAYKCVDIIQKYCYYLDNKFNTKEAMKYDYIWAPMSCGAIGATGLYIMVIYVEAIFFRREWVIRWIR